MFELKNEEKRLSLIVVDVPYFPVCPEGQSLHRMTAPNSTTSAYKSCPATSYLRASSADSLLVRIQKIVTCTPECSL